MSKTVSVAHLNGCDRCAWHMLVFDHLEGYELVSHPLTINGNADAAVDLLILTGYAEKQDKDRIEALAEKADKVLAYGTCPYSGGIFGLKNQRGGKVLPIGNMIDVDGSVLGCPPEPSQLLALLEAKEYEEPKDLCSTCNKTFESNYICDILRPGTFKPSETCFNNQGVPCSGVVSAVCAQRCIDFDAPCRGCVNRVDKPSSSMIGFFGSLAAKIEVATQGNWWTTDKLADDSDDISESLVDIVGTFFRFHLASGYPRGGIVASTGNDYSDIMVGRPIEEAIQIAATIYGSKGISVALNLVEGYEKAIGQEPSDQVQELRQSLREAQKNWINAFESPGNGIYAEVSETLHNIAGNEVLSNVFFGGFRTVIANSKHPFDSYNATGFEPSEVEASYEDEFSKIRCSTDAKGIIREWSCEF